MITTAELLSAVKAAQNLPSNYRLARMLDVPEGTVQRWNTGRNRPDDAMAVRLAELAGLDPAEVLASLYAERAADTPLRAIWETLAKLAHHATLAILAAILAAGFTASPDAQASALARSSSGAPTNMAKAACCTLARIRRFLRALSHRLVLLPSSPAPAFR